MTLKNTWTAAEIKPESTPTYTPANTVEAAQTASNRITISWQKKLIDL
jgi:hypothetical protein